MFKVGDKVFDFQNGWGVVTNIGDSEDTDYVVDVDFSDVNSNSYTKCGKFYSNCLNPTLSFQEYGKDFTQERPELEYVPFTIKDAELFRDRWVKQDDWTMRIAAYGDKDVETEWERIAYKEAFDRWTFEDGSKFGKLLTK